MLGVELPSGVCVPLSDESRLAEALRPIVAGLQLRALPGADDHAVALEAGEAGGCLLALLTIWCTAP